ncbi:DNA-directed RNA polymerase II subunit RPB9 [Rhizoclosmatium sp. JEL0117]|nr:DNA-directed RNA polymerase II subunit RPB9 [Rhizoclosmatium sp. JEL0117]
MATDPKEDKETRTLIYMCRNCHKQYSTAREHQCVFRHKIKHSEAEQTLARVDLSSDPTYPRVTRECPECGENTVLFFQSKAKSTDATMQLYFACCNSACGHRWTVDSSQDN